MRAGTSSKPSCTSSNALGKPLRARYGCVSALAKAILCRATLAAHSARAGQPSDEPRRRRPLATSLKSSRLSAAASLSDPTVGTRESGDHVQHSPANPQRLMERDFELERLEELEREARDRVLRLSDPRTFSTDAAMIKAARDLWHQAWAAVLACRTKRTAELQRGARD
jgi:hypothetical protein